ncbi:hypothetical protein DESC_480111 [Desulfosarcina cetonica]|nr:hypothetical protein DESC_480111 [Desulfosarcina cetonica]
MYQGFRRRKRCLMLETTLSGVDHGNVGGIAGLDDLVVVVGASGLHHGGDAFADSHIHAVAEGEERVTDHAGPDQSAFLGSHAGVDFGLALRVGKLVVGNLVAFETVAVGQLAIGLVAGDFGNAHAVLLTGADADGNLVLDVENRIGRHPGFHQPTEQKVIVLPVRWHALGLVGFAVYFAAGRGEVRAAARRWHKGPLGDDAAVDQTLEFHAALADEILQAADVADPDHAQVFLPREDIHDPVFEVRCHDHLGILAADSLGRGLVDAAVEGDAAAEGRHAVGHVGLDIGRFQAVGLGHAAGVVVLDDHRRGTVGEIAQDIEGIIRVGQIGLPRVLAGLQQFDVRGQILTGLNGLRLAEHQIAIDQPVQGRFLTGILAVAQPFLNIVDGPGDLLVKKRLAKVLIHKADLHLRRKVIVHDRAVHFFQIVSHAAAPFMDLDYP